MMSIRPNSPPASRHRCRRRSESGPAYNLSLAGFFAVTLAVAAASHPWMPRAKAPAEALAAESGTTTEPPLVRTETTQADITDGSANARDLARLVARRYRVADGAAGQMVGAVLKETRAHDVDPMLVLAVIAVESRFNPVAASEQGALGLMQVVPRFHMDKLASLGVAALLRPEANIAVGVRILKDALRRGGSDIAAGLQLYNGAVDDDSRAYANRVLDEQKRIERALPRHRDRA